MGKVAPAEFVRQVKQETKKVTWLTSKETMVSTVMVLVMVSILAAFFFIVDGVIFNLVQWVLGF